VIAVDHTSDDDHKALCSTICAKEYRRSPPADAWHCISVVMGFKKL